MSEPYNAIETIKLMIQTEIKVNNLKAELAEKTKAFEAENYAMWEEIKTGESFISQAKDELKHEALKAFIADPSNKKPFPAVQIKEITSYEVDEKAGLAWARVNAPIYVLEVLDTKAIKKVAPVLSEVPEFIKVTKTPQAQIASDLNAALQAVTEGAI
jgi:hypothetical protein